MNLLSILEKKEIKPPKSEEIEISIFGKGIGECLVIHLGENNWIIVDTFLDNLKQPIPLQYIKFLGLTPKNTVKAFIATHWHDDHIRGAARIHKECEKADFICSEAIEASEFFKLAGLYKNGKLNFNEEGSGVDEFVGIFENILQLKRPPNFVSAFQPILKIKKGSLKVNILALSPSQADKWDAKTNILSELSKVKPRSGTKRISYRKTNNGCVALWIEANELNFLLGSDLESNIGSDRGWEAIISSPHKPNGKANLYKVAHHGSKTGHLDAIWDELLHKDNHHSILTPYNRSNIPQEGYIQKISELSPSSFAASHRVLRKITDRSNMVEKTIRESTRSHKVLESRLGFVQVRFNIKTKKTKIALYGAAIPLNRFVA
jgi:beta-lactamase superfamily II metal-dependent hydrolase